MNAYREWMYKRILDNNMINPEFLVGIEGFVKFASTQDRCMYGSQIRCPCTRCTNKKFMEGYDVLCHLTSNGFLPNYYIWTQHGEDETYGHHYYGGEQQYDGQHPHQQFFGSTSYHNIPENVDLNAGSSNQFRPMVMDLGGLDFNPDVEPESPDARTQHLYDLLRSAEQPLYEGSSHTQLSAISRMLSMKADHGMSERCFDELSDFFNEALPEGNTLPSSFYKTKKLVQGMGLPVQEIHCCEKNCMLYWGNDSELTRCKFCGRDRYKEKKIGSSRNVPRKKMYYFPITPRLQRLYQSEKTANDMRWHEQHESDDGVMNHPSDSWAWKHFDMNHPNFKADPRNVRLGLCTDGFSAYGQYGTNYSSWPVVLTVYNLPHWLCMKEQFLFLTIICPGPKNPKHKLDVFLQPLIAELQQLWDIGVKTYDAASKRQFRLRAALMWTISDFPAYAMLSGWSTAGKLACPHCMENSQAFYLPNGRKVSWFDHRKFLDTDHPYRGNKKEFLRGKIVVDEPPPVFTGEEILVHIDSLGLMKITEMGAESHNKRVGNRHGCGWKKRSIFWDLTYWTTNLIRHNLDIMHIEKNFFDNIWNTLLSVPGKTKDNANSRVDLQNLCYMPTLAFDPQGEYPNACYQLLDEQISAIARWVRGLRLPDGFVSNLGRLVDDDSESFRSGMKSHDCHIFMQKLLPVALKPFLPKRVWEPLTELSLFFRDLTSSSINSDHMWRLETDIPLILCKLERIFPPSFFDSMEHLPVHLPYEARMAGPAQYRWMYRFERFIGSLKRTIKNKARVEASMANAYLTKEAAFLCSHYFEPHVVTRNRRVGRFDDGGGESEHSSSYVPVFKATGRVEGRRKKRYLNDDEFRIAHSYILLNSKEVDDYVRIYIEDVNRRRPNVSEDVIDSLLKTKFPGWFQKYVQTVGVSNGEVRALAEGPKRKTYSYPMYFTGGYKFQTVAYESNRGTKNSGVCVKGITYGDSATDYYGELEEVIELEYWGEPLRNIILFKCKWFDPSRNGTRVHKKYKIVEVHKDRVLGPGDPFILAFQASQVAYMPCPSIGRPEPWLTVCKINPRYISDIPTTSGLADDDLPAFQEDGLNTQSRPIMIDSITIELNFPIGRSVQIDENEEQLERAEEQIEEEDDDDEEEDYYDDDELDEEDEDRDGFEEEDD